MIRPMVEVEIERPSTGDRRTCEVVRLSPGQVVVSSRGEEMIFALHGEGGGRVPGRGLGKWSSWVLSLASFARVLAAAPLRKARAPQKRRRGRAA